MGLFRYEELELNASQTLEQAADRLVAQVRVLMSSAKTEEDLRIGFEKPLEPLCKTIGVSLKPQYERSIYAGGRTDAMHGQVIIEYDKPLSFRSQKAIDEKYAKLREYLTGLASERKTDLFRLNTKFAGVGFDGERIFFVVIKPLENPIREEALFNAFQMLGPYNFDRPSAITLLAYLRSLDRRALNAENLTEAFGPGSPLAAKCIGALVVALAEWDTQHRAETFYREWQRLFGIVYGEQFNSIQALELKSLTQLYGVGDAFDVKKVLFAIHTYYVLLIKLVTVDLLYVPESSFTSSLSNGLVHCDHEEFLRQLNFIEDGGIYNRRGIQNFLEGDFFRWYLYAMWPGLEDAIRDMARVLTQFEPASPSINPELARDLLKDVYQDLVPREIRHRLGEYFTPDWLAQFMLDELGYDGDSSKRLLDPACGTGTFLVLAVRRAKNRALQTGQRPLETLKGIISGIWGFDLNPLAVIAARTNFLLALGDLLNESTQIEIRIYLADSVLWPERRGQMQIGPAGGEFIPVPTSATVFNLPRCWVKNNWLLRNAAVAVERLVSQRTDTSAAMEVLTKEGLVFPPNEKVIEGFYDQVLQLEREGKNGIWARFLKNLSAPMIAEKFHFVVGNPPWIRWDYLSSEYRAATLEMWKDYGLFSLKGFESRLGGGKKDFAMLFTYAAADYYLTPSGALGFLITQEVFKTKGAGEGFRRFRLGKKGPHLNVIKAHDFTSLQPFEDAANKTAAIILKKGSETKYPVPYFVWSKKGGGSRIPSDWMLDEVRLALKKTRLNARPVDKPTSAWQTMTPEQEKLNALKGECAYTACLGANPNPYGVFWLEVKEVLSNGNILVRNLSELGKQKTIKSQDEQIEPDLVYPALRGSDIKRWKATPQIFMLVTQNPQTRRGYPDEQMEVEWTRTRGYLLQFKKLLLSRPLYRKYHEQQGNPFYSQFNISEETFAPYKTVWKAMSDDIISCVVSTNSTPIGHKKIVPQHTTAFFSCGNKDEAHFLCAILNSQPVREFVKTFSSAGRGFGSPSVIKHIRIPKFQPQDEVHSKLSESSKRLHEITAERENGSIKQLELEVDKLVARLFCISE